MNPIDGAGNILNEKDAVVVHLNAVVKGVVVKIKEAPTLMAKENQTQAGFITINVPITIPFNPMQPNLRDVFRIVKPPNWDKPES
jgi:hypothetical protein